MFFQQNNACMFLDNVPVHKSVNAMAAINDCDFEFIQHPPFTTP
jgi:hypothetical protein